MSDRFSLQGRVAIIGGGTGIGRAAALLLAKHGRSSSEHRHMEDQ